MVFAHKNPLGVPKHHPGLEVGEVGMNSHLFGFGGGILWDFILFDKKHPAKNARSSTHGWFFSDIEYSTDIYPLQGLPKR